MTLRFLPFAAVFLALASLTACKQDQPVVAPGAVPLVQSTTPAFEAPKDFASFVGSGREIDSSSALVLSFSKPLDSTQTYDDLISVLAPDGKQVKGAWAIDDGGQELRFPFVAPNLSYQVKVAAGIKARDGETTVAPRELKIYSGNLAPVVGFASQGSVLASGLSDGLPIMTVNVDQVDVEFLRVRPEHLSKFFVNYADQTRRGYWELNQITELTEPAYRNRFAIDGLPNQRLVSNLPVGTIEQLKAPGVYFAVLQQAGRFASEMPSVHFFVSDLGLHLRVHKSSLWVTINSLQSAKPIGGVDVQLLDMTGRVLKQATTANDGSVKLDSAIRSDYVVVARLGDDATYLPLNRPALDLSEFSVAGGAQLDREVFIYSGRDLYRPGETLKVSALVRDFDGKAIADQPIFGSLELPNGRVFERFKLDPQARGYFEFNRLIPEDASTGRWTLRLKLDPSDQALSREFKFHVEDFLPERMKLEIKLAQAQIALPATLNADIAGAYLYGAPASGNRLRVRATLDPATYPLEALKGFWFGDAREDQAKAPIDLIDEELGADGKLQRALDVFAKQPLNTPTAITLTAELFESGGRPVVRSVKALAWPKAALIGIKPSFADDEAPRGADVSFELVRSDLSARRLAASKVTVQLIRERVDYNWVYSAQTGWQADEIRQDELQFEKTLDIAADSSATLKATLDYGSYRLEAIDPSSGLKSRYSFNAGWGFDSLTLDAPPDKVKLNLDKAAYKVGDKLTVTLTSPHAGRGYLLVESDELLSTQAIDVGTDPKAFEISVDERFVRHDIYVTALVLRPGESAERRTPKRALGVIHVPLDRLDRTIAVKLEAPKTMRPLSELKIKVSAPALAGTSAQLTLSAVDEGIINITRYPLPDAGLAFFAQRRMGVDARDIYGRVIENLEGAIAKLKYGGDGALAGMPQARRPTAKVLTVDLFSGVLALDAQGSALVTLKVPDFNGSLRLAALVFADDRFGRAEAFTQVRAPLVAEVSSPRVLAPGDEAMLTLDLKNFSGAAGSFEVRLQTSEQIRIDSPLAPIELADKGSTTLSLPLTALTSFGVGKIQLTIKGAGIELNREFEIPVRPAYPGERRVSRTTLAPNESFRLDSSAASGWLPRSASARLAVSTQPPLGTANAAKSLLSYPYACLEQTASLAVPLIAYSEAELRQIDPANPERERIASLNLAFSRLASMQMESGDFALWPASQEPTTILTPFIADVLLDAKSASLPYPDATLERALKRLLDTLNQGGNYYWDLAQSEHLRVSNAAYAAYVLSRVNQAPLGALRNLNDSEMDKVLTALPWIYLGSALIQAGDPERGNAAIERALKFPTAQPRPDDLFDFSSDLRDQAEILRVLVGLKRMPEVNARLSALSGAVGNQAYFSTAEHSALLRLSRALSTETKGQAFTLDVNRGGDRVTFSGSDVINLGADPDLLALGLTVTPSGAQRFFVSSDVTGFPMSAPAALDNGIQITRRWFTLDGKPFVGSSVKQGESYVVYLRVESAVALQQALVTDLSPAGLEVENLNLSDSQLLAQVEIEGINLASRLDTSTLDHEEFRDDRYVAALRINADTPAHLFYLIRAVSPGSFVVPPAQVEDMYRPELRSLSDASARIRVE